MERELLLLGLLRQSGMHGYKIIEFIERDLAMCTDLKKPTAYFLLDKMAQNGWISWTEEREGNRPPRRIYQITSEGEVQFQKLLRESLSHYAPLKFTDDIALAFADGLPRAELVDLLTRRRDALLAVVEATRLTPAHPGFIQLGIDHQLIHLESELRWMDNLLERVSSQSITGGNHGFA
ncbi:MAG: PadR family transcriptional regulator [Chloroflexota bacterium]